MSEIVACYLDAAAEDDEGWYLSTKSFAWRVFSNLEEKYAGVLTLEEIRIAQPASEKPYGLSPQELAAAVAREAERYQPFSGRLQTDLELLTKRIQEKNELNLQLLREYEATRPDIRRPAELLTVLQKIEQHLRTMGPDWYSKYDNSFMYDTNFEELYTFLREADRQEKLISWSY